MIRFIKSYVQKILFIRRYNLRLARSKLLSCPCNDCGIIIKKTRKKTHDQGMSSNGMIQSLRCGKCFSRWSITLKDYTQYFIWRYL